jgi:hypothetical protein
MANFIILPEVGNGPREVMVNIIFFISAHATMSNSSVSSPTARGAGIKKESRKCAN